MNHKQIKRQVELQTHIKAGLEKRGFIITAELKAEMCGGKIESDLCATAPDGEQYHIVMLNRNQG